ncbi:MAG TPA: MBG domain-containing protein [Edaphobacter sp.]|nr:MBG domain-containing protein [Edaphobacter sp.]
MLAGIFSLALAGCGGSSAPTPHATLTVTAADASRIYGAANPALTATASGAAAGDTFTLTASTVATPSSPAGAYAIVPAATGANLANYNVVYINGNLTVGKATLTVTPGSESAVAGSLPALFGFTITGLVNGDGPTAHTGFPSVTTTATTSSPPGTYPITATLGTLAAANYTFTFGTGTLTITPAASNPGAGFSGIAKAGTRSVVGATVQLYAAGTSGDGSTGTSLLSSALTTNAGGTFTVPPGYACPAASSQLYLVVRGGQAEATVNPALTLATPIGACNQLASGAQFVINEVTTAATAWGLSQFLSPGGNIGATPTNTQGLANAAATVASLVNLTTGTSPGPSFPQNASSPATKINSLANLLNTCTTASSPSDCNPLFSATTPTGASAPTNTPTNTLDAALNLVRNPGANVAALYTLSTSSTAFTPALATAPSDWTLFLNFTGAGMNSPSHVAIDASGNVWVASYFSAATKFSPTGNPLFPAITSGGLNQSYGLAIDAQNNAWIPNETSPTTVNQGFGTVTVIAPTGQLVSGQNGFSDGGLAYPIAIAIDNNGTAWVVDNYNASLTQLSSTGQPLSGPTGFTSTQLAFPVAIALDTSHNAWIANSEGTTITQVSPDGRQFTSFDCCNGPHDIAIDQRGFIWVANYFGDSISQLAGDGSVISTGYTDNQASIFHPNALAIDGAGHVWSANYLGNSLTELAGSAAPSPGQILSPTPGYATDAALNQPFAVAIDASGNLWTVNFLSNTLTEIVGLAAPVKTPQSGPVQSP